MKSSSTIKEDKDNQDINNKIIIWDSLIDNEEGNNTHLTNNETVNKETSQKTNNWNFKTPTIQIERIISNNEIKDGGLGTPQHEYIKELIEQVQSNEDYIKSQEDIKNLETQHPKSIQPISPEILASEELLTTMIEDVQQRLAKLELKQGSGNSGVKLKVKNKHKELKFHLQTLKSALVAERSQLRAARLDPLRYNDFEEDIEQEINSKKEELTEEKNFKNLSELTPTLQYDETELNYLTSLKDLPRASSPSSTCGATVGDEVANLLSPLPTSSSIKNIGPEEGLRERMARQLSLDDGTKLGPIQYEMPPSNVSMKFNENSDIEENLEVSQAEAQLKKVVKKYDDDAFRASMTPLLSDKKFVAFAYCSWCFKQTVHGRVQRNLLRRSRYKCTECSQVTLKCRTLCGAMARGHQDYDEELCARCDGTLNDWGEERPYQTGYCSACYHFASHYLLHRGYVLHDTYRCSYCKATTFLCATCHTDFGAFESNMVVISELLHYTCAKCSEQIDSWEDPISKSSSSGHGLEGGHLRRTIRYVHPFESFAEVRSHVAAEALIDGRAFFDKSYTMIEEATDSIFMSCWWLSPFVHLRRNSLPLKEEDRLCDLLWRKADEGIQIFILLWNNSLFLSLCSEEAKFMLEDEHPNIHIMRDPAFSLPNFLWSHHQKFTVVDFTKAIVGGFDYAVGRYDTFEHPLIDLGLSNFKDKELNNNSKFLIKTSPSFGYSSLGITSMSPLNLSPSLKPNLVNNAANSNYSPPFLALPNSTLPNDEGLLSLDHQNSKIPSNFRNLRGMQETLNYLALKKEQQSYVSQFTWLGLDYYQPQDARPENYQNPTKDIIDRYRRGRMPWHDISVYLEGLAAYDVAYNFIERWNHHRKSHTFEHVPKIGLPKPPAPPPAQLAGRGRFSCEVQIVRSLDEWSGLQGRTTEASVYGAYLAAISKAQHYIYIENQYVVSSTAGGGVENRIIVAILERIRAAIENKKTFRVFIMFPIPEETGKPANHMLQLSYQTLFRGGLSLLDQFKLQFPNLDPFDYVGFYFLRTYSILPNLNLDEDVTNDNDKNLSYLKEIELITDMVFVHSKMLIVDDELVIIASNNLNDRSMLGTRDSELGAVILDTKRVRLKMDQQEFYGRKFAYDLRVQLWREHLGLSDECYDHHPWVEQLKKDPISDATYHEIFRHVANKNTEIYKKVFPMIPSNAFQSFNQWLKQLSEPKLEVTEERLNLLTKVQGNLCFHPTRFCSEDSLDWAILEDIMGNELVS